jgi:hypothetical protein
MDVDSAGGIFLSAITLSSQNIIVELHYQQKKKLCSRWLLPNI